MVNGNHYVTTEELSTFSWTLSSLTSVALDLSAVIPTRTTCAANASIVGIITKNVPTWAIWPAIRKAEVKCI